MSKPKLVGKVCGLLLLFNSSSIRKWSSSLRVVGDCSSADLSKTPAGSVVGGLYFWDAGGDVTSGHVILQLPAERGLKWCRCDSSGTHVHRYEK